MNRLLIFILLVSAGFSLTGFSQTYTTRFEGIEDPLSEGGKWANNGVDWTRILKVNGVACGTQTGTNTGIYKYDDSYAHLSGFPPNQEAWGEAHIAKPNSSCNQELEILLRWTSSTHRTTGYECFAGCLNSDSSYLQIVRWDGPLGKFTYLADMNGTNYGFKNGDILKASIVGNVITVYINGVQKAQVTDDTFQTGDPGIGEFLACERGQGLGSNGDFGFSSFTARGLSETNGSLSHDAISSEAQNTFDLRGRRVLVQAEIRGGRLREQYSALRDGSWIAVATSDQAHEAGSVSLLSAQTALLAATVRNLSLSNGSLVEEFALGTHRIVRTLAIVGDSSWIRITSRLEPSGKVELRQFYDRLKFLHQPDWSFSPSVGGFNPDAQYKAPLILVQAAKVAFGIVPDVSTLGREELKRCNHALDLDVPAGPMLGVGFMPARLASHSVYAVDTNRVWQTETPLENNYYLLVTASAEPAQAFREAVRFHWERFGRAEQSHAADQQVGTDPHYRSLAFWDDWREVVWKKESAQMWISVPLPDGSIGGGVRTERWGPGPSVYLSSWFNTLRTSYGMALYARRTDQADLLKLAGQTLQLALKAPGKDGAFKCIAVPGTNGSPTLWGAGDGSGGSTKDGFLGYDMCWTGYWLLKWRAAELPGSEGVLPRCRELAAFMMARQLADGMLPTRFAEDASVQQDPSKTVKAETGPAVLFLLELYDQDRNPSYLEAARKGLNFLEKEVIPKRQWYDYETFWSCSPRTARLDERTQQWPANNLALSQTVTAFLLAYRVTNEPHYLAQGEALLDYLLLFQQCWTNPRLENLAGRAMLLGGFTTQNSDAEWSDARQSQCGNVLLDYYRATGKVEYLERGIAALRAQFPISPSENWAHVGYGAKAGVSSFHWGTGSGMAGIEIEEDYLHDGIIDVAAARGAGVNGLNLEECSIHEGEIRLSLSSPFQWKRPPVIVFRHTEPSRLYKVLVNGMKAGSWRGEDLEKGIPLSPSKEP